MAGAMAVIAGYHRLPYKTDANNRPAKNERLHIRADRILAGLAIHKLAVFLRQLMSCKLIAVDP